MTIDELIVTLKEAKEYFGNGEVDVYVKDRCIVSIDTKKGDDDDFINLVPFKN